MWLLAGQSKSIVKIKIKIKIKINAMIHSSPTRFVKMVKARAGLRTHC